MSGGNGMHPGHYRGVQPGMMRPIVSALYYQHSRCIDNPVEQEIIVRFVARQWTAMPSLTRFVCVVCLRWMLLQAWIGSACSFGSLSLDEQDIWLSRWRQSALYPVRKLMQLLDSLVLLPLFEKVMDDG